MQHDAIISVEERKGVFLNQLRSRTTGQHRKLEANSISVSLVNPSLTKGEYVNYLKKAYGFIAPFEQQIFAKLGTQMNDIDSRKKAHLLAADLNYLGVQNVGLLPMLNWNEILKTTAAYWGGMYVLEGSTLGGNILYKKVNSAIEVDIITGASFFACYSMNTGKMWKIFLDSFTDYAISKNCEPEVIDGAVNTFSAIDNWFSI